MVECAGLEIPCTFSTYRGFESHPLRQSYRVPNRLTAYPAAPAGGYFFVIALPIFTALTGAGYAGATEFVH